MAATLEDVTGWFDYGVRTHARYLIVLCDTYDWTDYPVYCADQKEAVNRIKSPGSMQKVMECYDLQADKVSQLRATRTMALTV